MENLFAHVDRGYVNVTQPRRTFSQRQRLLKRPQILEVQTLGTKFHSRHFLIAILPAKTEVSRLAVTVSTKVHKRAVRRNYVKRRVREIFRQFHPKFSKAIDLVVIARRGSTSLTSAEIRREILGAMKQAGYLKPRGES